MGISAPNEPKHLVVVVGGAVSGSEAARVLSDAGVQVVVIEQHHRPYGKMHGGLPRWQVEQRRREYRRIDRRLDREGVELVPNTALGDSISVGELLRMSPSAIVLAAGMRRDRHLPTAFAPYEDRGLIYQGPLVHWFCHYQEQDYDDQWYVIPDGTIVIGGGRASLDVLEICAIEAARMALLDEAGVRMDVAKAQEMGLRAYLESVGTSFEQMQLKGPLLLYRRSVEHMRLTDFDPLAEDADHDAEAAKRKQLLEETLHRCGARFQDTTMVRAPIASGDRLVGLQCVRTDVEGSRAYPQEGSEHELDAPLVVAAVGSVPEELPGLHLHGEAFMYIDPESGESHDADQIFGVGGTVEVDGVRTRLRHSSQVARYLLEHWLPAREPLSVEHQNTILGWVADRHRELGYDTYAAWTTRGATGARLRKLTPPPPTT